MLLLLLLLAPFFPTTTGDVGAKTVVNVTAAVAKGPPNVGNLPGGELGIAALLQAYVNEGAVVVVGVLPKLKPTLLLLLLEISVVVLAKAAEVEEKGDEAAAEVDG